MNNLKVILMCLVIAAQQSLTVAQTDYTAETKLNQSSTRKVSGNENLNSGLKIPSKVPQQLLTEYNAAIDSRNESEKYRLGIEIEKYLDKPNLSGNTDAGSLFIAERNNEPPFDNDWYSNDVLVAGYDVATSGGYRQIDMKQGEDGWMYLAVNIRNPGGGANALARVYRSSNGGANWSYVQGWQSTNYWSSISMLVESRNNSVPDSTRILLYVTSSPNLNFNDAFLACVSFTCNGTGSYSNVVANPSPGNRFATVSACSDGMFWSSTTYMHIVVREESNGGGVFTALHHFRSINWGFAHTSAVYNLAYENYYPRAAFSNETGNDSIYISFERRIANDEWEVRLLATDEIPSANHHIRYITDATAGTLYKRPDITIQQRHYSLPQQILVTCTKNDRAVYHGSTDGGASWNIDLSLGLSNQPVDFTSCNSDTLTAGNGYFIAAYVDLNGDSVNVRRGVIGAMGNIWHKRNSNQSTGTLAPECAIYRSGTEKYSALVYAGNGPTNVYYNMESLISGIQPTGNSIPEKYALSQNYPNPFNPVTNIEFAIPKSSMVKLVIYDIGGRIVETIVNRELSAGTYKADWNASGYSSGVYFYKLESSGFTDTKKMMIIK